MSNFNENQQIISDEPDPLSTDLNYTRSFGWIVTLVDTNVKDYKIRLLIIIAVR
mgnify:CR=1 FL=1